jgi:hypothetical protein
VATDVGLIEYHYGPAGADPEGAWLLRGEVYRWGSVKGLRLQTDAQIDEDSGEVRGIWRLIAEQPKIELVADTTGADERSLEALLPLAHACMERAG